VRGAGRGRLIAAAAAVVAAAVAVLVIAGVFSSDSDPGPPPPPPSVRGYDVGGQPDSISAGAGYVWVADSLGGSLSRINPGSKRPIVVETAGFPTDVSAGEDAAWLALGDGGAVQRVSGTEGASRSIRTGRFPFRIAAGEGAVWAMSEAEVERINPDTGEVGDLILLNGDLSSIAAGEGAVWVVRGGYEVVKIDPGTLEIAGSAEVPGAFSVATGESAVWALGRGVNGDDPALTRLNPGGAVEGDPIPIEGAGDLAAGLGFVWTLEEKGLTRRDPDSGEPVGDPLPVGGTAITVGEGSVWVASPDEGTVYRVTP
jgi:hypothetical protein